MNVTFDIETTGLPPKGGKWDANFMDFPYIVQFSWKISDQKEVKDYIIKPEGYKIPIEATEIHGISTDIALEKGEYFENVVKDFIIDCLGAEKIIGHNLYFDTSIIKANILRKLTWKMHSFHEKYMDTVNEALHKDRRIDTMYKTISFCSIPFPNGKGKKWPSLVELYDKLFGETFPAHNSKEDVIATERCYNELVKLKII